MVTKPEIAVEEYKYGFADPEDYVFKSKKGLNKEIVEEISRMKGEPDWMRDFRLKALDYFKKRADAKLGRGSQRYRLQRHLLLRQSVIAE